MLYYANPVALTVGTAPIEPVYLGITAVADTNLSMNFTMYCTASSSCTVSFLDIGFDFFYNGVNCRTTNGIGFFAFTNKQIGGASCLIKKA